MHELLIGLEKLKKQQTVIQTEGNQFKIAFLQMTVAFANDPEMRIIRQNVDDFWPETRFEQLTPTASLDEIYRKFEHFMRHLFKHQQKL